MSNPPSGGRLGLPATTSGYLAKPIFFWMSGATANRAVFFSGLTVILALAGMLIIPLTIFRGLAGGAILVVLVSLALSMTLLPALLSLFGKRVEPLGERINWPWKSLVGNVLVLLLILVAAGVGAAIPSAFGAPSWVGALLGPVAAVLFIVFFTRAMKRGA